MNIDSKERRFEVAYEVTNQGESRDVREGHVCKTEKGGMEVIDVFFEEWKQKFISFHISVKKKKYKDILEMIQTKQITKETYLISRESFERIQEIADQEVKAKKEKLIAQIAGKVGNILDVNLKMNPVNGVDGVIKGDKASATIRTILAGGDNIQCLHYRTLVKTYE